MESNKPGAIALSQVGTTATRTYFGTLCDGASLHAALEAISVAQNIVAGTVELLGGLSMVEFTAYDFVTQRRHPPLRIDGALEVVGGNGTISRLEGKPHVHLHLVTAQRTVPDAQPEICAGHVKQAHAFAIEFVLTAFDGVPVNRKLHAATGLQLWHLPPHPLQHED